MTEITGKKGLSVAWHLCFGFPDPEICVVLRNDSYDIRIGEWGNSGREDLDRRLEFVIIKDGIFCPFCGASQKQREE
jgi:hypothetical protein